jgi:hypothetical protein
VIAALQGDLNELLKAEMLIAERAHRRYERNARSTWARLL